MKVPVRELAPHPVICVGEKRNNADLGATVENLETMSVMAASSPTAIFSSAFDRSQWTKKWINHSCKHWPPIEFRISVLNPFSGLLPRFLSRVIFDLGRAILCPVFFAMIPRYIKTSPLFSPLFKP